MSLAFALAILTLTDCILAGFRAAAGRNGRLDKRVYYADALRRATIWALALLTGHVVLVAVLVQTSADANAMWSTFLSAATICVWVYGVFATLIFGAFAFYFAPIGDFRVLTNVIVFGPLTLTRRLVIAAGLIAAVVHVRDLRVGIVAGVAGVSMLFFEDLLARKYRDQWKELVPGSESLESP